MNPSEALNVVNIVGNIHNAVMAAESVILNPTNPNFRLDVAAYNQLKQNIYMCTSELINTCHNQPPMRMGNQQHFANQPKMNNQAQQMARQHMNNPAYNIARTTPNNIADFHAVHHNATVIPGNVMVKAQNKPKIVINLAEEKEKDLDPKTTIPAASIVNMKKNSNDQNADSSSNALEKTNTTTVESIVQTSNTNTSSVVADDKTNAAPTKPLNNVEGGNTEGIESKQQVDQPEIEKNAGEKTPSVTEAEINKISTTKDTTSVDEKSVSIPTIHNSHADKSGSSSKIDSETEDDSMDEAENENENDDEKSKKRKEVHSNILSTKPSKAAKS